MPRLYDPLPECVDIADGYRLVFQIALATGDLVVVLEAMKMEQPLNAHKEGVITSLSADVGLTVASGAVICEIKDAG